MHAHVMLSNVDVRRVAFFFFSPRRN